jgi:hypothetical protein
MAQALGTLPNEMVRSITWNQGAEMTNHKSFTIACPRALTCPSTAPKICSASNEASTVGLARHSDI